MKKIYLSLLSLAIVGFATAQISDRVGPVKKSNDRLENYKPVNHPGNEQKAILWQNDCSVETDWSYANTSNPAQDWFWTTDVNAVPAAGPANMTTASNGYFMIDSDAAGQSANQNATVTYNNPITVLGAYPTVVLEFEHHYRTYLDERYVEFSTDGGVTWPHVVTVTDGTEGQINVDGVFQYNVSSMIGGQANVMMRFRYIGNWGWHWAVDDIRIIEQPADDIQLLSAWIAGENNEGTEYGRNPDDQLDANWYIGGQIFNFGALDQTNVDLTMDFTAFSSNGQDALLEADSTVIIENLDPLSLTQQVYQGTFTATSDNEQAGGPDFGNNVRYRNFEVTDHYYSQDGIGIHPPADELLTSIGTDSFTGVTDGLVCASWYHIKNTTAVGGIEIVLANGTVAGGEVFVSIIDTATLFADQTVPLVQSQIVQIDAADITAGSKTIMFDSPYTLNPGCYYAAVEMYSNGNANDIRILDDITVIQPYWASVIFIPQDQTYTNGEALAIRMVTGDVGIEENSIEGISVYPNPSEGIINVTNKNSYNNVIEVIDVAGNVVLTKESNTSTTLDLTGHGAGVYMVKISNNFGSVIERVVIK